jgi:hypothetical protein
MSQYQGNIKAALAKTLEKKPVCGKIKGMRVS